MSQYKMQCTNPDCARSIRVPEQGLGHRIRCPACKQEMRVPGTIEELNKLHDQKHYRIRIVRGPAFAGTAHTLEPDRAYTFGRSDECNVQLPGPTVSKRHFSLHWVNNQWVLEDLNTTTGTQVDGLGVTKHALRGGETVEVGAYVLELLQPGAALHPEKTAATVVIPTSGAEPLALHAQSDGGRGVREAEEQLRAATGFVDFKSEHLARVGQDSARRYSLSLATRLVGLAALLVAATVLSLFGKSWFFPPKPVANTGVQIAAEEPLPTPFTEALDKRDFELAATLLQERRAGGGQDGALCVRMEGRLRDEIRQERDRFYQRAQQALNDEKWDQVDQALQAAQAPALGPLPDEWKPIRDECRLHGVLVEAQAAADKERWRDALAKLQEAEKLIPGSARTARARGAIETAMGAGLLVKVQPAVPDVRVTLNAHDVAALGEERWKLPAGPAKVAAIAPGYFGREQAVELRAGHLAVVDFQLMAQAPAEVWALAALERIGAAGPIWLAAKHYADRQRLARDLLGPLIQQSESEAIRKLKRSELRVAKITLKGGEQITARIWAETGGDLTTQLLPKGDTRVLKKDDLAGQQSLEPRAAAEMVLNWIRARREAGTPLLETLEQLAKLRLDLGSLEELATQVCGDFVETCLRESEHACGFCAGAATAQCSACEAKGFTMQVVTCKHCNGAKETNCQVCAGTGKERCSPCHGSGHTTHTARDAITKKLRTVEETCTTCAGSGQVACSRCHGGKVACPKCKGAGKIEDKVTCPECKKGVIPCPACNGTGTKEGMVSKARDAAEVEAAKRIQPSP